MLMKISPTSLFLNLLLAIALLTGVRQVAAEEQITLQLKWMHCFQFAGYYAALEKGYYREAGLDVRILEMAPGVDVVNEVVSGRADFATGNSSLLLARKDGKPVVVLANIFQHSPLVIVAAKRKPSETVHDLAGRRIMMEALSDEVLAFFKHEQLPLNQLRTLNHTFNLDDLVTGKTDAMTAYITNEPYFLDRLNFSYQMYSPRSAGIDFYGDNLFTSAHQLRDHPMRVKAFRDASLRGWDYALSHPDEIIELLLRKYPRPDNTREYYQYEAAQMNSLIRADLIHIGYMNPGRWQHIADIYAEIGMLPGSFSLDGFLYDASPEHDLRKLTLYLTLAIAALILFGVSIFYMIRTNRRLIALQAKLCEYRDHLEKRVSERTIALSLAKEAAEAAESAKTSFLANMGHELRTPITLLMGYLFLLKREITDEHLTELITSAEHSTMHLTELLNDILDYSSIEAGSLEIESIPFEIKPLLELAAASITHTAKIKGLKVSIDQDPSVPARLKGDPIRIGQVLESLLSNAVKFSEEGSINIHVHLLSAEGDAVSLRFEVNDQGIGIEPDLRMALFKLFNQGDNSSTRKHEGTGLGLALCRQLVTKMGGQIGVNSAPGFGSSFWFTLTIEICPQVFIGLNADNTPDWKQLGFVITYLGKLLALDDMHARTLWAENSRVLEPVLQSRAAAFQQTLEAFDFEQARLLLLEAIAERPELSISPAPWNTRAKSSGKDATDMMPQAPSPAR